MRGRFLSSRTFSLGLILAMAGLCYATATSRGVSAPEAADRGVGTSAALIITTPLVPSFTNDYDLGDMAPSQVITRVITAAGGLRPYRFTSSGPQSLAHFISGTDSSLALGLSGFLTGRVGSQLPPSDLTVTGVPGLRFVVNVKDSEGTQPSSFDSFFNLYLVNPAPFRFAMNGLPNGPLDTQYLTKVETVGGVGNVTISVVSISGAASTQEALGIFFDSDGYVFGKPLVAGTVTVTLHAVDSKGTVALSRAGTGVDQAFTFTITPNTITASDVTTTNLSISGDTSKPGRDRLTYQGLLNSLGQDSFSLNNSPLTFRVGDLSFTGNLDRSGNFKTTLPDKSKVTVHVDAKTGKTRVNISQGSFATALNAKAFVNGTDTRKGVGVVLADAVIATEVLDLKTRVSGSRYSLGYRFGNQGKDAGGTFQIISVKGKDSKTFSAADSYNVKFLAMAATGLTAATGQTNGLDGASSITTRIGAFFTQKLTPSGNSSKTFHFRGNQGGLIKSFSLNSKSGAGKLETGDIPVTTTNIPNAANSPKVGNIFFSLGLDVSRGTNAPFTGEHARRIFGLQKQYSDQPSR
jgi:hypothetical protein